MAIDQGSLLQFVAATNRRIAALERHSKKPGTGNVAAVVQRQFIFVRLCEPLFPGKTARGNIVVWNNAEEDFIESGTGCVIVHDDICRTFALPGMVVAAHQQFNKLITYEEFGLANVPVIKRQIGGETRFEVRFTPHCYWDEAIYLDSDDPLTDQYDFDDDLFLSIDRVNCKWTLTGESASLTSTTTTTPTVRCEGVCTWEWDDDLGKWVLDEDQCQPSTTTTTTTTPDPGTSTTTTTTTTPGETPECVCLAHCTTTTASPCSGECQYECQDESWVLITDTCVDCDCPEPISAGPCENGSLAGACLPTSTTTTTTTTPAPCNCQPPQFCGIVDGDRTTTYCVPGVPGDPPDCTTTTPCDCTCDGECVYRYIEWHGWIFVSSDCPPGGNTQVTCGCQPPATNAAHCAIETTPCVSDPKPPRFCDGDCKWVWIPEFQDWLYPQSQPGCYAEGGTSPFITFCCCARPSEPPDDTDECVVVHTPCLDFGDPDPGSPCDRYCTTTTTSGPCDQSCLWRWSVVNTRWELIDNNCHPSCPCERPPNEDGTSDDEIRETRCGVQTTTTEPPTTTSTTTTTTTTFSCYTQQDCRWQCIASTEGFVWVKSPQDICDQLTCMCPSPPNPCTPGDVTFTACVSLGDLDPTTTTTEAPPTTTSTTTTTTTTVIGT